MGQGGLGLQDCRDMNREGLRAGEVRSEGLSTFRIGWWKGQQLLSFQGNFRKFPCRYDSYVSY